MLVSGVSDFKISKSLVIVIYQHHVTERGREILLQQLMQTGIKFPFS